MTRPILSPSLDSARACIVRIRLGQGYGADDILAMDGIPPAFTWDLIRDMEAAGTLHAVLGLRGAAA